MKNLAPILFSAAALVLAAGCSTTPVPSAPVAAATPAVRPGDAALLVGPEAGLKKGMRADAVRRIMGSPTEIRAMKAPSGKAETWIYRRTVTGHVQQVEVGVRSTPITDVAGAAQGLMPKSIDEPIMQQETEVYDVAVNLLMFDDVLIEQNRVVHQRVEYR